MIPRECKRLAEVDFPIAVVSRHAVREKSIPHREPSMLRLWLAGRPVWSPWHEVTKVQHYLPEVDAMTKPMGLREDPAAFEPGD